MQFQYVLNAFFSENETFTFVNEGKKNKVVVAFPLFIQVFFFYRAVLNSKVFEAITARQKVNNIFQNYELLASVFR